MKLKRLLDSIIGKTSSSRVEIKNRFVLRKDYEKKWYFSKIIQVDESPKKRQEYLVWKSTIPEKDRGSDSKKVYKFTFTAYIDTKPKGIWVDEIIKRVYDDTLYKPLVSEYTISPRYEGDTGKRISYMGYKFFDWIDIEVSLDIDNYEMDETFTFPWNLKFFPGKFNFLYVERKNHKTIEKIDQIEVSRYDKEIDMEMNELIKWEVLRFLNSYRKTVIA